MHSFEWLLLVVLTEFQYWLVSVYGEVERKKGEELVSCSYRVMSKRGNKSVLGLQWYEPKFLEHQHE